MIRPRDVQGSSIVRMKKTIQKIKINLKQLKCVVKF